MCVLGKLHLELNGRWNVGKLKKGFQKSFFFS